MLKSKKNVRRYLGLLTLFALVLVVSGLLAQSKPEGLARGHEFTAARIKYTPNSPYFNPRYGPPWYHDYPTSETNLMRAVKEFTLIDVHHSPVIVTLDDPDLFKYPWAYLCEVGYFSPTDSEVKNMREYMNRGGLLIVDDFDGGRDWQHFQMELKRILPDRKIEPMTLDHPLLRSFFNVDNLDFPENYRGRGQVYYIADDKGRLMMVINVNLDVSEYWEWAGTSYMSVKETNEAFKLGVNYIIYAMTH
jgi:hypothetical protein